MASGGIITTNGKNWLLNRGYKATTDYDEIYYLKLHSGKSHLFMLILLPVEGAYIR